MQTQARDTYTFERIVARVLHICDACVVDLDLVTVERRCEREQRVCDAAVRAARVCEAVWG